MGSGEGAFGAVRISILEPHGFCSGVSAAIRRGFEALGNGGKPVYCLHELVHNATVVRDFELRGMRFVDSVDDVPEGGTVLFSAHGVSPAVRAAASRRALSVVDATCPFVARVHRTVRAAAERGIPSVVIGNAAHAEVIGVVGEAEGFAPVAVVRTAEDVARLDFPAGSQVAVVSQTTLCAGEVAECAEAIAARWPQAEFSPASEVCNATRERQMAVRKFASCGGGRGVLVIGSGNSSNTRRLVEIAAGAGARAWRAEDAAELGAIDFSGIEELGITSGASTPETVLHAVVAELRRRDARQCQQ